MKKEKDHSHHNSIYKWQHLHTTYPDVQINGENIQLVNSEILLMAHIDNFRSWFSHKQNTHTHRDCQMHRISLQDKEIPSVPSNTCIRPTHVLL